MLKNKYYHWYFNIIEKFKQLNLQEGENHHILPLSMGGDNSSYNLVRLSFKAHFLVHWLLTKFTEGEAKTKMYLAFRMMVNGNTCNKRVVAAWQYSIARKLQKGIVQSDKFREKQRINNTGSRNPMFGRKHSPKSKRKISEALKNNTNSKKKIAA